MSGTFEGGATQPAGMHRRSNAVGLSPRAVGPGAREDDRPTIEWSPSMPPAGLDNLSRIVVLMMENRSFDHMLGGLMKTHPGINGLTGNESNPDTNGTARQMCCWFRRTLNIPCLSTGLTLRAGGFPEVYLLSSWGGHEGTPTI